MLQNTIKKIAKKVLSKGKGLFTIILLNNNQISFKNARGNVFSFDLDNYQFEGCGTFAAGYVIEGEKQGLTFDSEYQNVGTIKTAKFCPYHISYTDNPNYVLKNALHFTLN